MAKRINNEIKLNNTNIFRMMENYLEEQKRKKKITEKNEEKLKYIPKNIFSFLLDYTIYNNNFHLPNSFQRVGNIVRFIYKDFPEIDILSSNPKYIIDFPNNKFILDLKFNKNKYILTLNTNCVIIQIDTNGINFPIKFKLEENYNKIFDGYELFISPSIQERINSISSDLDGNCLFYNIFLEKFFIVFENMNLYINENQKKNSDELYYIIVGKNIIYFNHELYFKKISPMKKATE